MPTVTAPKPAQPSCSGVNTDLVQHEAMVVENAATGNNNAHAAMPVTPAQIPATAPMASQRAPRDTFTVPRVPGQPKKGVNVKNRNAKNPVEAEGAQQDPTLNERMSILGEITKLMKASYGTRQNEVEVWGQYIGLKAGRLREGRRRDRVLMQMEEMLNEALYDEYMTD